MAYTVHDQSDEPPEEAALFRGFLAISRTMYARYGQTAQAVAALPSVQPFANVVGYYACCDGKDKGDNSIHAFASFPAGDAAAA